MERKDLLIKLGNELLPKKERRRKSRKKYNKCAKRKKAVVIKKQEKDELRRIKTEIAEYQRNGRRVFSSNIIKKENPTLIVSEQCAASPKKTISTWTLVRFSLTLWSWWKKILLI